MLGEYVCVRNIGVKSHWERADIGQDINETDLTNEKCLIWQTSQSKLFIVLWVLWELPSQPKPRDMVGIHLGLHLGLSWVH